MKATDQIDRLIASRTGRDKANEREEMYAESVRWHREKLRLENRWEWIRFYECLAHYHAQLAEENRIKVARLLGGTGEGEGYR